MIKVELVEEKKQENEFPCLMKSNGGKVVLMTERSRDCGKGTVVDSGLGVHKVGYYSDSWSFRDFKPLQGKIILENK